MNDAAHLEITQRFGQLEEEHVSYYSRGRVTYIGQVGNFMIWDKRCILHHGCGYDAEKYRRRMHQTRVRGCCPSIAEVMTAG